MPTPRDATCGAMSHSMTCRQGRAGQTGTNGQAGVGEVGLLGTGWGRSPSALRACLQHLVADNS
jgi:hypothetical protein